MLTSTTQRILVIGATGMLGKPVADQLAQDGFQLRVLARSPEKARGKFGDNIEIYPGDIHDQASLQQAMRGCYGVHVNIKGGPTAADYERAEVDGMQNIVNAAQRSDIHHLTYLSAYTIQAKNALSPESRAKFKAEEIIRASGIPFTLFRASWFMESLPLFVQGQRAMLIGNQPHPLHWIAAADYARMVSQAYQTTSALNKALYIYGPQALTMRAALQTYIQLVNPRIQLSTLPIWLMKLIGKATFNPELQSTVELLAYYNHIGEEGDPQEANSLLGKPQTTLQQWCERNSNFDHSGKTQQIKSNDGLLITANLSN